MAESIVIKELLVTLGVDASEADKALAKFDKATDGSAQKASINFTKIGEFAAKSFAAIGTAAVGAAVGIFKLVDSITAAGDNVAEASLASGLAADEYQRLAFAARKSGVPMDAVAKSARFLEKSLDDARRNATAPAAIAFDELGISLASLDGKSFEERLGIVADSLNGIAEPQRRALLLARTLGEEGGPRMAALLADGSAGVRALGDEAERLGVVLGDDAIKQSEELQDTLDNLKATFRGVAATVGVALVPVIRVVAERIQEFATKNRDLIASKLQQFMAAAVVVVTELATAIGFLVANFDNLAALFVGVKLAQGFSIIAAGFQSMGVAAAGALGPIGLVAGALTALIPLALDAGNALGNALAKTPGTERTGTRGGVVAGGRATSQASLEVEKIQRKLANGDLTRAQRANVNAELANANVRLRDAQGADERRSKRDAAAQAARDAAGLAEDVGLAEAGRAGDAEADALIAAFERKGGGRKGGGRSRPKAAPPTTATLKEAVSPFLSATNLRGGGSKGLPGVSLGAAPTVTVSVFNFTVTAPITVDGSKDPGAVARLVTSSLSSEIQKAAQDIRSTLVR